MEPSGPDETAPAGQRGPGPDAFLAGDVLSGRYRIVKPIGHGTMGEVFEAEDLELGERVALKALRRELASDPQAAERFRREVLLARSISHPNTCRLFDMGWHESRAGSLAFLTMELLPGETLAERLRRDGPMSEADALPLVRQMAAALDAAHAAGVVHRDFKSGNVVLVSVPGDARQRVVVTDFGLAQRVEAKETDSALTGAFEWVGTPAYVAPEQVAGGRVTVAADVYALGVVMYEMLTGEWPFAGETPQAMALARLTDHPKPPHRKQRVDPRWEAAILRCLERAPEDRFTSCGDVVRALEGRAPVEVPSDRARRGRRLVWMVGVGTVAIAVAFLGSRRLIDSASPPTAGMTRPAPTGPRRAVAILVFAPPSAQPGDAWLATALAELVAGELGAGDQVRIVPGDDAARAMAGLGPMPATGLPSDALAELRANLSCDIVLAGQLVTDAAPSSSIAFSGVVQDAVTGTATTIAETGTRSGLRALAQRAAATTRAALGLPPSGPRRSGAGNIAVEQSEAMMLHFQGVESLRQHEPARARALLDRAAGLAPDSAAIRMALAHAQDELGMSGAAAASARLALLRASRLTGSDRLQVEAGASEVVHDWDAAVAALRTLFEFFPDDPEVGRRLATAQAMLGRREDAARTIEALRKFPSPASEDPRIDLCDALASTDPGERLAATLRAQQRARDIGARQVVVDSRRLEASLRVRGDLAAAVAAWDDAARLATDTGDRLGSADALQDAAAALAARGRLSEAATRVGRAAAQDHEATAPILEAGAEGLLATIALEQGSLDDALAHARRQADLSRGLDDAMGAAAIALRARVQVLQGRLDDARASLAGSPDPAASAAVHLASGDVAAARTALGVSPASNLRVRIELADGDGPAAEAAARESIAAARAQGRTTLEAEGQALLARALLVEGRAADAQAAVEAARAAGARTESLLARLTVAISALRVASAAGDGSERGERVTALRLLAAEAAHRGLMLPDLEARIALADDARRHSSPKEGKAQLKALAKEAQDRGLGLLERDADASRRAGR